MQERIESIGEFVVSRSETTKLLEAIEESLDEVSSLVAMPVDFALAFPVAAWGNDDFRPRRLDDGDQCIAVVAFVGDDRFGQDVLDRGSPLGNIGYLARRQDEVNGVTQCVYAGVNPGAQSPPTTDRSPDRYCFFGCAGRVLVGSNNRGIDEHFKVGISLLGLSNAMSNAVLFPAGKADIYRLPVAQYFREIAPRASDPRDVQQGIDKPSVISRSPTFIRRFAK